MSVSGFRPIRKDENASLAAKRWAINPSTGEVITRRAYQDLSGYKAPPTAKRENTYYKRELDLFVTSKNKQLIEAGLSPMTRGEARTDTDFKNFYKAMKSKDTSAKGKKAQALIDLGLRSSEADYPVGDTPGVS